MRVTSETSLFRQQFFLCNSAAGSNLPCCHADWNLIKRREKRPVVSRWVGFGACFVEGSGARVFRSARLAVSVATKIQEYGLQ